MDKKFVKELDITDEKNVAVFITCANPLIFAENIDLYYFFLKNSKNEVAIVCGKDIERTFDKYEYWFKKRGFDYTKTSQKMLFIDNDATEYRIINQDKCLSFGIKKNESDKYIFEMTDLQDYASTAIKIDEKDLLKLI